MVKLICISVPTNMHPLCKPPEVGEKYHAEKDTVINGIEYWLISELQTVPYCRSWYEKVCFVPGSDIDETQFVRNFQTQEA